MNAKTVVAALAAASWIAVGCGGRGRSTSQPPPAAVGNSSPTQATQSPPADAGVSQGGGPIAPDAGAPDAGASIDAGVDAGTLADTGPWPTQALLDYSQTFNVGTPQSVGIDDGFNIWLLDGARIGVLRPGDSAPRWTSGIGQASQGFGADTLATGSTVICGGEAGRAYVGYSANDLQKIDGVDQRTWIPWPGEPYYSDQRFAEYLKGDLDVVRLQTDGSVALEEHLWRTIHDSNAGRKVGLHNTNDFHYDEDRSVLNCARMLRGPFKGDLFISTNHGVTLVQGLVYNSHRHPGWYLYSGPDDHWGSLQTPPTHGLGIARNGEVLIANEQEVGIIVPDGVLEHWDRENTFDGPVPWRYKGYNEVLNSQEDYDYWRAFEQTVAGRYFLGSSQYGLWEMKPTGNTTAQWTKLSGLPTDAISSMKSTDDGALYIGTDGAGLWRMEPDGTVNKVTQVAGSSVLQMVYVPIVTPSMLMVLTDHGLTVLRGP